MGKKNRNKKKKKKESDGRTGNVNGGSSNSNNSNEGATMGATTTTTTTTTTPIILTAEWIDEIDHTSKLKGYPKSKDFIIGYRHYAANQYDLAIASLKHGAENDSCVPCMYLFVNIQMQRGNFHLLIPWALEGAIRGHIYSMKQLIYYYVRAEPIPAHALSTCWLKTKTELGDTQCTEERRMDMKKSITNKCFICGKKETENNNDVTLVTCEICKFYSYCGKDCQTYHWKEGKHRRECRQVILLRKYCKPSYIKEIRDAIMGGQDPKEIHTLQRLRMKLGLNRPMEEYEELLLQLDDKTNNNNITKPGTKVRVNGLVKASVHNGKLGIVTNSKVGISSILGEEHRRVGVELLDDDGSTSTVAIAIKIQNLELASKYEWLIGRKDGTVHIGSTPNAI